LATAAASAFYRLFTSASACFNSFSKLAIFCADYSALVPNAASISCAVVVSPILKLIFLKLSAKSPPD